MRAIIAGGGIGGLATAAALAQRGWETTVYERQSELRTVGSGIYIWENGVRVLEELGAYDEATAESFYGNAFEHRDATGEIIDTLIIPEGHRLVTVMRGRLLGSLHTACRKAGVVIKTNQEVVSASPKGELVLARGDSVRADLAVGIDGIWSNVRRGLGIRSTHDITPEGCLRTIIRREPGDIAPEDAGKYIENWAGSRRLLITPISDTEIYLALTCLDDDDDARRIPVDTSLWEQAFPQWRHLIARISGPVTWGRYSVLKCDSWSGGRTAILGDSAHAQPPNLGQGGGMAMRNGLALAAFMEDVDDRRDVPDALEAWEHAVRPLTDHCQKWSTLYGEVTHLPDEVRSKVFRGAGDDGWVSSQILRASMTPPLVRRPDIHDNRHLTTTV